MRIIVVDDEPAIADTLVDILIDEGWETFSVADGQAAIHWSRMIRPDVVIVDVMMPGINGIETAAAINRFLPECRIILFSGQAASVDLLDKARADGYQFEVLAKPIKPRDLLAILRPPQRLRA
jgi:DNA-binding response OmpR family regulator